MARTGDGGAVPNYRAAIARRRKRNANNFGPNVAAGVRSVGRAATRNNSNDFGPNIGRAGRAVARRNRPRYERNSNNFAANIAGLLGFGGGRRRPRRDNDFNPRRVSNRRRENDSPRTPRGVIDNYERARRAGSTMSRERAFAKKFNLSGGALDRALARMRREAARQKARQR